MLVRREKEGGKSYDGSSHGRRTHTIMSPEDANSGKKSSWPELEISGSIRNLSNTVFHMTHLSSLYLSDNQLIRIPPDINRLTNLVHLDLSSNKLRQLPSEIGDLVNLRELLLNNNSLRNLPFELGKLYKLTSLGLKQNPLTQELMVIYQDQGGMYKLLQYLLDNINYYPPPPERPWRRLGEPKSKTSCLFTVLCYNVLCDKMATRNMYGYCPSWALSWDYRKDRLMGQIKTFDADIICLQEVETEQFYSFFMPELENMYVGIFEPKSRARTMNENERRHVDGCAIMFKKSKFSLVKTHLVEFNQLAMSYSEGSDNMLNRVMTKDNIGLAALLETKEDAFPDQKPEASKIKQPLMVCTAHIHWDPEYCDVKLIQTMMLMNELKNLIEDSKTSLRPGSSKADANSVPMILCADMNSLPDSAVFEFITKGHISNDHADIKDHGYKEALKKLSSTEHKLNFTHPFHLNRAHDDDILPFTNYTGHFKGVIDYVFYSRSHITEMGHLGPISADWLKENKVIGFPHPNFPSDHFPLLVEMELAI